MKNINLTIFLFATVIFNIYSQSYPFPHTITYTNGSIKPNIYTQTQMNAQVEQLWNEWKAVYLQHNCSGLPNEYYVLFSASSDTINTSEGMGYGMMLAAYMAGYDDSAKVYYDGLYNFYKAHPSDISGSNYLMAWQQLTGCVNSSSAGDGPDAATDGDMDMAYSLLLADKQWGSAGAINYKQAALNMINDIMSQEINGDIIKLGDWYNNTDGTYGYSTRSSDFIIDHFRAFLVASGNTNWTNVINKAYSIVNAIQTNYSPATGLLPDFIINCNTSPAPAAPYFLESPTDGDYDYNACRDPWRLGTDYLLSGTASAKTACDKISAWISAQCGKNANNILSGYTLSGGNVPDNNFDDPSFIGPFGVGAMCNSANQQFVNSVWDYLINDQYLPMSTADDYFQNTLQLLSALVMSGNYWPPMATAGYTLNTTIQHGTITVKPEKVLYNPGDTVTLTVTADSAYKFTGWSGNATGTANPLTVIMNSNKNDTANITSNSGQWCDVQTDLLNTGKWKGGKDSRSTIDSTFTVVNGQITASWTIAQMSAPNAWDTYVEVDGYLKTGNMSGLTSLQITYKSDQPLVLSLIQPGILADSGACYGISLGVSNTLTTITAPISQFLQPDWSDLTAIPLQLDSVKYVSISPNVDPTNNAVSGTIVVSELLLCNVSPITGIKNISGTKSRIKVYPNPAENVVYIESNNLLNARIDIMNISGATVISKESINSNIEQIDVSGLSRGMYFIRITNSDNSVTQKLMIK